MKCGHFFLALFLCISSLSLTAQHNQAIGEWRSYLPYTKGTYVTQTDDEVWYASDRSILIIDKEELSTTKFDKIDGLSDVDIKILEYSPENEVILAAYHNSNIDIISKDRRSIHNIGDIKRNIELQGDKRIYDVLFLKNEAFLATGFGIVKLNLKKFEIALTVNTGIKVNTVTLHQNQLYAATDEGVFYAPLSDNFNLQDFGKWEKLDTEKGFPDDYTSRVVYDYKGDLFLDIHDSLFMYKNNSLEYIIHRPEHVITYLETGQNRLIIHTQKMPYYAQFFYLRNDDGTIDSLNIPHWCLSGSGSSVAEDKQGRFWIGDYGKKFNRFDSKTNTCSNIELNSAYSVSNSKIAISDNELWVTAGTIKPNWNYGANKEGFASYINGEWALYHQSNTEVLSNVYDMIDVEVNPKNGLVYIGSYMRGFIVFDREKFTIYNESNSALKGAEETFNVRVPGLALDKEGHVWMSNHSTSNAIALFKNDGTWKTFPSSVRELVHVDIDNNGYKWFTTGGRGIVVFHEGDDIDNHADNKFRYIHAANSELPTNDVYDLVADNDGDIWVGTSEGIVIFECGSDAFKSSCVGTKRVVKRPDGNNAHLLKSETVRAIAVDGANRKWVGTKNGVYLISADGLKEIHHFTEENSPLFDNLINDITINKKTGEVVIGTQDGIISFMGDATTGNVVHNKNVFAFPNPIAPDYDGPISVRGLAVNATVKITDIRGRLVYETQANGGQVVWDGKDYNGVKAAAGVYLVFSVNEKNLSNPDGYVTKILKMR